MTEYNYSLDSSQHSQRTLNIVHGPEANDQTLEEVY
jgi:hypothetical protein